MTQLLPPKKEVALALLERSNVDIYLDPRAQGVVVPPQFRKEPRLILKIGLNMPVPIPDLRLDDESMSCTLSFNRAKFFCVVPWPSVFAMVGDDGRGMVWPDDVPQELAARGEADARPRPVGAPEAVPPSSRGGQRAAPRGQPRLAEEPAEAGTSKKKSASKKKKDETLFAGRRGSAEGGTQDNTPPVRPMLHAVPSPPASSPRLEKAEKASVLEKVPDVAPPSVKEPPKEEKAAPAPRPAAGPSRPKRELPPYLRVVK
jgi:stringent starvation protein B